MKAWRSGGARYQDVTTLSLPQSTSSRSCRSLVLTSLASLSRDRVAFRTTTTGCPTSRCISAAGARLLGGARLRDRGAGERRCEFGRCTGTTVGWCCLCQEVQVEFKASNIIKPHLYQFNAASMGMLFLSPGTRSGHEMEVMRCHCFEAIPL